MQKEILLVGSSKGLIVWKHHQGKWDIQDVHFRGFPVSLVYVDERTQTWWAGISHRHWGQKLHFSKDFGKSWESIPTPTYPKGSEYRKGKPAKLKKIWSLAAGGVNEPEVLWMGTEPGGLFKSVDGGKSFQLVESLWNHPSRMDENQWFGAGRDDPFMHAIIVNPQDSRHIYIAVSCAGIFESKDGGDSWEARNNGLVATYLPNPRAEVGHDPHALEMNPLNPSIIWQQNHCGIFRTTDGGEEWKQLSQQEGIAHYGFALATDEKDPEKAWVIPAISDEERVAHGLSLYVAHTGDGGKNWEDLREGLPQEYCFDIVFRHAFTKAGKHMAFGTTNGNLFLSANEGQSWQALHTHFPRIDSVVFTGMG